MSAILAQRSGSDPSTKELRRAGCGNLPTRPILRSMPPTDLAPHRPPRRPCACCILHGDLPGPRPPRRRTAALGRRPRPPGAGRCWSCSAEPRSLGSQPGARPRSRRACSTRPCSVCCSRSRAWCWRGASGHSVPSCGLRRPPGGHPRPCVAFVVAVALVVGPQAWLATLTLDARSAALAVYEPVDSGGAWVPDQTPPPVASDDPDFGVESPSPSASAAAIAVAIRVHRRCPASTCCSSAWTRAWAANTALTDTMIVASLDPVGKTVSMASIPRDMVDVPLPDGRMFKGKINGLVSYVRWNPGKFPGAKGRPVRARRGARWPPGHQDRHVGTGQPRRVRVSRGLCRRRHDQRDRWLLRSALRRVRDQRLRRRPRSVPHERQPGARLCTRSQGGRRERLHPRCPAAGADRGSAGPHRAGRLPGQPGRLPRSRWARPSRPTSSPRSSRTTSTSPPRSGARTSSGWWSRARWSGAATTSAARSSCRSTSEITAMAERLFTPSGTRPEGFDTMPSAGTGATKNASSSTTCGIKATPRPTPKPTAMPSASPSASPTPEPDDPGPRRRRHRPRRRRLHHRPPSPTPSPTPVAGVVRRGHGVRLRPHPSWRRRRPAPGPGPPRGPRSAMGSRRRSGSRPPPGPPRSSATAGG